MNEPTINTDFLDELEVEETEMKEGNGNEQHTLAPLALAQDHKNQERWQDYDADLSADMSFSSGSDDDEDEKKRKNNLRQNLIEEARKHKEINISRSFIRDIKTNGQNFDGSLRNSLYKGDRIEGNYRGRGLWYPGSIARVLPDGTYDIQYDKNVNISQSSYDADQEILPNHHKKAAIPEILHEKETEGDSTEDDLFLEAENARIFEDILKCGSPANNHGNNNLANESGMPALRISTTPLKEIPIHKMEQYGGSQKKKSDCKDSDTAHTNGNSSNVAKEKNERKVRTLNLLNATIARYFKLLHDIGELQRGSGNTDEAADKSIMFVFNSDEQYQLYEVSLYGLAITVDNKYLQMTSMLDCLLSTDGNMRCILHNWTSRHVLALQSSKQLSDMERHSLAVARFYSDTIKEKWSVETTSLSNARQSTLLHMLQKLKPRHTRWDLPPQLLPAGGYVGPYSLHIESQSATEKHDDVQVLVWGFDRGPELALQDLLLAPEEKGAQMEITVPALSLEIPSAASSPRDSAYSSPLSLPDTKTSTSFCMSDPQLPLQLEPFHHKGPPSLKEISAISVSQWRLEEDEDLLLSDVTNGNEDKAQSRILSDVSAESSSQKVVDFLAAAPTSPSIRQKNKLSSLYPYHSQFIFQDREAGIYYQAFQQSFAHALNHAFGVYVAPLEAFEEVRHASTKSAGSGSSVGSAGNRAIGSTADRTRALRVEFFGKSNKDCVAAVNYLSNELGSGRLERIILYFPRADASVCKILNEVKEEQDRISSAERAHDAAQRKLLLRLSSQRNVVQNPLLAEGFVNIRFKPFMMSKTKYFKNFPVDISVTICGPAASPQQILALERCERAFKAIQSNHFMTEMVISSSNPYARVITPKVTREQFVNKYGLVGLRIDESARRGSQKPSGLAGIAILWAPSEARLRRVVSLLKEGENEAESAMQRKAVVIAAAAGEISKELPGSFQERMATMPYPADEPMLDPALCADAPENSFLMPLKTFAQQLQPDGVPSHCVVNWPHASCRFMFLEERLKLALAQLVQGYRNIGVKITTPYRDKKDTSACMLLEGGSTSLTTSEGAVSNQMVQRAARAVRLYMESIASRLCCIKMQVPSRFYDSLSSGDLSDLKSLQGKHGVHIILEPTHEDLSECSFSFNMEKYHTSANKHTLKKTEFSSPSGVNAVACNSPEQEFYTYTNSLSCNSPSLSLNPMMSHSSTNSGELSSKDVVGEQPLTQLSFSVINTVNQSSIHVEVISDESSHWSRHGANALLVILDSYADSTLTPLEIAVLASGEALVYTGENQTMIRVRPEYKKGKVEQMAALAACLTIGILKTDSLGITGLALCAPAFSSLLSFISPDELKIETARVILNFIRSTDLVHLRHIVFIENVQEEKEQAAGAQASLTSPEDGESDNMSGLTLTILDDRTNFSLARALSRWIDDLPMAVRHSQAQPPDIILTSGVHSETQPAFLQQLGEESVMQQTQMQNQHLPPISLLDMEKMQHLSSTQKIATASASQSKKDKDRVIVLKGLPNNVLNTINALWLLWKGKS